MKKAVQNLSIIANFVQLFCAKEPRKLGKRLPKN